MRFSFVVVVCVYLRSFVDCRVNYEDFGHIKMNGLEWTLEKPNNIVKHLNVTETYQYFDGETVNVTCYLTDVRNQVNITTNAFDSKLTYKKPIPISHDVYLYMRLTKENDGDYIDCLVSEAFAKDYKSSFFRITLHYNSAKSGVGFLVNGTYALQTCYNTDNLCYEYQYFDQENISVKLRDNELFTCDRQDGEQRMFNYKLLENHSLNCFTNIEGGTNSIKFVSNDAAGYTPVIKGLSMSKTLAMFRRNSSTFTILYEHYEEDHLSLDCVVKSPHTAAWEIDTPPKATSDVTLTKYTDDCDSVKLRGKIKITSNSSISGTLHCITRKLGNEISRITEIILVRTDQVNDYSLAEQGPKQPKERNTVMIAAGVGVFLLACLVMGLIAIKLLKKKSIIQSSDSQINYENLPEHNKGAMSIPQQWNEAKYSMAKDTDVNNDYALPDQSDGKEMYAEVIPKNKAIKGDSANASIENLGPTYAKPVPKHLRDKNLAAQLIYAELESRIQNPNIAKKTNMISKEMPYAEIMRKDSSHAPSGNSRSPYAEPDNSESPYAEPDNSESPYAEPDNSESPYAEIGSGSSMHREGYVNVFDNQRYVNANGKDDYAEPAYCELNNVHK